MDELYAIFLSWAVTITGYPAPDHKPTIVLVPHSYLEQVACKGQHCKVVGWFPPGEKIYLDERLDAKDDLFASSIVVHEMVHYLQHRSGKFGGVPYSCRDSLAMEREAYQAQREYLLRYGVYYPVGISMNHVGCELTAQEAKGKAAQSPESR
jgi:hypothetical protein